MKSIIKSLFLVVTASIIFFGCETDDNYRYDDNPPAPPTGIYTVTGDNRVDIFWDQNTERDVAGYNVYYSYSYDGRYEQIGSTASDRFIDYGAKNGETYYYAVTAYDYNNNESELSYDVVYDTPRPEGFDVEMFDYRKHPDFSGYDFSEYKVGPYDIIEDNYSADFFFENYTGTFYLDVWDDGGSAIQDMGPTRDIWDITEAPVSGWSSTYDAIALEGHTYVIRTWDYHYAKVRIKRITNDFVRFDWAYQLVKGNRELKPVVKPAKREKRNIEGFLERIEKRNKK